MEARLHHALRLFTWLFTCGTAVAPPHPPLERPGFAHLGCPFLHPPRGVVLLPEAVECGDRELRRVGQEAEERAGAPGREQRQGTPGESRWSLSCLSRGAENGGSLAGLQGPH